MATGIRTHKQLKCISLLSIAILLLASCSSPTNVDVKLREKPPEVKVTSFSQSILDLGKMSRIYNTFQLNVMAKDVGDVTGTSMTTGGEIPRDITEMVKSTLNAIGGNVVYVPYDPAFLQNSAASGYSNFENKVIPDVVMTGAITEFDRGLDTRGKNTNFDGSADVSGLPSWVPGNKVGIETESQAKSAVSRITLDFNLINFQTLSGIARMQAVNSIKVDKATASESIGFALLGPTIGLKGSVKKVQGRHAAVRLLVEMSMIQIIGKFLVLPYWNLVPAAKPDPVVLDSLSNYYYSMSDPERVLRTQELLYLHGYDVSLTGAFDQPTLAALQQFDKSFPATSQTVDLDTYINLYASVPVTNEVLGRRHEIDAYIQSLQQQEQAAAPSPQGEQAPVRQEETYQQEVQQQQAPPPEQQAVERTVERKVRSKGGGRILREDEW